MAFEIDKKKVIIGVSALVLLVGSNIGAYYGIWKPMSEKKYEPEIAILKNTLAELGPMTTVWTVNAEVKSGDTISQNDLVPKEMPASFVLGNAITDPSTVRGKYYKLDLAFGTPLSEDLVMAEEIDDTTRTYDIVSSTLPIGLKVGDYIDYRLVYPMGEDYIVLPHKRVQAINGKVVTVNMNELEIHYYQSALVDYFLRMEQGSTIYMTKYVEPGVQKDAKRYYSVPKNILAVMTANPNIITKANASLNNASRQVIDSANKAVKDEAGSAVSSGRQKVENDISAGDTDYKNKEQSEREAREAAEAQGQFQNNEQVTQPEPPNEQSSGSGKDKESNLEVGEGVVE